MREIKFRAWNKLANKMAFIDMLDFMLDSYRATAGRSSGSGHLADIELMQFTGLKDKNGKEVYEGDICTVKDGMVYSSTAHRMIEGHYQVYWNNDRWGLRLGEFEDYDNGDYYRGDEITWRECEVIGNTYENPELLEARA